MGLFNKKKRSVSFLNVNSTEWAEAICSGYVPITKNPEVISACKKIAEIISCMTIKLMSNTDKGDIRIKNELSRKVDIFPCKNMTRATWMNAIVMNLLLYGQGNAVVRPHTANGYLGDLEPIPAYQVSFLPIDNRNYKIQIMGQAYDPADLLHFVYNPDPNFLQKGIGISSTIKGIVGNLTQAQATKEGFMKSKWKPSVIIKVDAMSEELSSPAGRKKILEDYVKNSEAGEPWLIPAEQFAVEQIKPLSLSDLAINESVEIDKKTVASILGVPSFILGVGEFQQQEWNAFVNNTIKPIVRGIEQELTKKLLTNPNWYWEFNVSSLYAYDLQAIASVYGDYYTKGIVTGNEVRDKISMPPKEGLDDLIILENFIKLNDIQKQGKLNGGNKDAN